MNRNNKYFAFQKEFNAKVSKFVSLEMGNSMLGEGYGSSEMNQIERWVTAKGEKLARRFWYLVNKEIEAYHTTVEGFGYSAYEMDCQMMNY